MIKTFSHEIQEEVQTISGWYRLHSEARIEHRGKTYLYLVGDGVVDTSCCGVGGCRYVVVPGAVIHWKSGRNEKGVVTSDVEPVSDESVQAELRKILMEKENVTQVQFW